MNIIKANVKFNKPLIPFKLEHVSKIILHHLQSTSATVEVIHQWHLDNGWAGIGYNEYITKDGVVYICRGDNIGAHCQGHNSTGYGIAVEGDYSKELYMPKVQMDALVERIVYNKNRFKNYIGTFPHSYFVNTECPGRYFPMTEIVKKVMEWKEEVKVKNISLLACIKY